MTKRRSKPSDLAAKTSVVKGQSWLQRLPAAQKDRCHFVDDLGLLLKSGMPVGEALAAIQETSKSWRYRMVISRVSQEVGDGAHLWESLERSGLISRPALALVRLGETSGKLAGNLREAAAVEEKQRLNRARVRSVWLYPAVALAMTVITGLGVAGYLLPRLTVTFQQLDVELPAISLWLLDAGIFMREDGAWAVPLSLAVIAVVCSLLMFIPFTRRSVRRWQLFIPGLGRLLRQIEVARFGHLAGTLLQAGLAVPEALELAYDTAKLPQYQRLYGELRHAIEDGYGFKAAFEQLPSAGKLLPPTVQRMMIAGERSGSLPEAMLTVGTMYEEKTDQTAKNLGVATEPALLLVIGGVVLTLLLAVLVPVYNLVSQVGS